MLDKNKRIRAVSAKNSVSRPMSGHSKNVQRTQFIESVYGGGGLNANKRTYNLIATQNDNEQLVKLLPRRATKNKQQLFQQTLHLKKTINKLTQQNSLLKGQIQTLTKRNNKYTKQYNMQFEKQIYWTGSNAHLIAGVKAQYDKLKQQYQRKSEQCQQAKKINDYYQYQQYKIYTQALQQQNKELIQRINKIIEANTKALDPLSKKQVSQIILVEVQSKKQKLQKKLHEVEIKLKAANEQIKDRDKKLMFLEKLIIEKDNNQYHSHNKAKKLQKQKINFVEQIQSLRAEISMNTQIYEDKLFQLRRTQQKKYDIEKSSFDKTLLERQDKIQKLQKQVSYLSTLLTYWKPLDEINKQVSNKMSKQDQKISMTESIRIGKNQDTINNLANKSFINKNMNKSRRGSTQQQFQNFSGLNQDIKNGQNSISKKVGKRIPQTADQRYSQQAYKKRKVGIDQIEDISNILKYRIIAQNLEINEIRKLFDFKNQGLLQNIVEGEQIWQQKYITMKEVKNILENQIFRLNEQDSNLLSRYIVQDSNGQYVYCDENNEISRDIAKSIIKTVIGEYEILDVENKQKVQNQINQMIKTYHSNLGSALRVVAANGLVSNKKLLQLISSLGIEISQSAKIVLVGKLAMQSQSTNKLKYTIMF